jgi:hypothetical protein
VAKRFVVLVVLAMVAAAAAPASADGNKLSIGYAYLKSLEDGGGSTPLGAFVNFAPGDDSGFELDLGFHRNGDADLNSFTGALGPRFSLGEGSPFLHVMGAVLHERVPGASNTAFGGMAGAGYDLGTGGSMSLRLGADFQMFFDSGESFKALRLVVGLTF